MTESLKQKAKEIYRNIIELELKKKAANKAGDGIANLREKVQELERSLLSLEVKLKQERE